MKILINLLLITFIVAVITSCKKYSTNYHSLDEISVSEYYFSDILPDTLQNLYGSWNLISSPGGFTGNCIQK